MAKLEQDVVADWADFTTKTSLQKMAENPQHGTFPNAGMHKWIQPTNA
jgi:hypothetical protein